MCYKYLQIKHRALSSNLKLWKLWHHQCYHVHSKGGVECTVCCIVNYKYIAFLNIQHTYIYIFLNFCWNLSALTLIIYYHMYFHLLPFYSNHFPPRSRAGRLLTRRQVTRIDTAGCGEAVEGPGWRCSTVIPSDLDGKCRHVGCPLVGKSVKFGEMVIYTSCETLLMIWGRFWNSGLWPQSLQRRKETCRVILHLGHSVSWVAHSVQ